MIFLNYYYVILSVFFSIIDILLISHWNWRCGA